MVSRLLKVELSSVLQIDRNSKDSPLQEQCYSQIKSLIERGALRSGEFLPSSRNLAKSIKVSRIVVTHAYRQLVIDGYLESTVGKGTCVSNNIPFFSKLGEKSKQALIPQDTKLQKLDNEFPWRIQKTKPFALTAIGYENLPSKDYLRTATELSRSPGSHCDYADSAGYAPLRKSIAALIGRMYGYELATDQIIITSNIQQSVGLACGVLFNPGSKILIENPGYVLHRENLNIHRLMPIEVDIDEEGINLDSIPNNAKDARGLLITPAHEFPLGTRMSTRRREQVLDWASRNHAFILEDAYDAFLDYAPRQTPPLFFDPNAEDSVVLLGSFSRTIYPREQVGFIVAPRELTDAFIGAKNLADRHVSGIHQAILVDFIESGGYEQHLRNLRKLYAKNQQALIKCLKKFFKDLIRIIAEPTGIHLVIIFHGSVNDTALSRYLLKNYQIETVPLSSCYFGSTKQSGLILGYGGFSVGQIETAAEKLFLGYSAFNQAFSV